MDTDLIDATWNDVSAETQRWLGHWLSGGAEVSGPSPVVVSDLRPYRLATRSVLYRGELVPCGGVYALPTSWTHDASIAARFGGTLLQLYCDPESTLVDTTRLPQSFMRHFFPDEAEVIALPGMLPTMALHSNADNE